MEIALYHHPKTLTDMAIRLWTWSKYSHVELRFNTVPPTDSDDHALCFSSSGRDGGTRFKYIDLTDGRWDRWRVEKPAVEAAIFQWCLGKTGKKYDFLGIFGFIIGKQLQDPEKWYCSEICAAALRRHDVLDFPQKISPGGLAEFMRQYPKLFVPVID